MQENASHSNVDEEMNEVSMDNTVFDNEDVKDISNSVLNTPKPQPALVVVQTEIENASINVSNDDMEPLELSSSESSLIPTEDDVEIPETQMPVGTLNISNETLNNSTKDNANILEDIFDNDANNTTIVTEDVEENVEEESALNNEECQEPVASTNETDIEHITQIDVADEEEPANETNIENIAQIDAADEELQEEPAEEEHNDNDIFKELQSENDAKDLSVLAENNLQEQIDSSEKPNMNAENVNISENDIVEVKCEAEDSVLNVNEEDLNESESVVEEQAAIETTIDEIEDAQDSKVAEKEDDVADTQVSTPEETKQDAEHKQVSNSTEEEQKVEDLQVSTSTEQEQQVEDIQVSKSTKQEVEETHTELENDLENVMQEANIALTKDDSLEELVVESNANANANEIVEENTDEIKEITPDTNDEHVENGNDISEHIIKSNEEITANNSAENDDIIKSKTEEPKENLNNELNDNNNIYLNSELTESSIENKNSIETDKMSSICVNKKIEICPVITKQEPLSDISCNYENEDEQELTSQSGEVKSEQQEELSVENVTEKTDVSSIAPETSVEEPQHEPLTDISYNCENEAEQVVIPKFSKRKPKEQKETLSESAESVSTPEISVEDQTKELNEDVEKSIEQIEAEKASTSSKNHVEEEQTKNKGNAAKKIEEDTAVPNKGRGLRARKVSEKMEETDKPKTRGRRLRQISESTEKETDAKVEETKSDAKVEKKKIDAKVKEAKADKLEEKTTSARRNKAAKDEKIKSKSINTIASIAENIEAEIVANENSIAEQQQIVEPSKRGRKRKVSISITVTEPEAKTVNESENVEQPKPRAGRTRGKQISYKEDAEEKPATKRATKRAAQKNEKQVNAAEESSENSEAKISEQIMEPPTKRAVRKRNAPVNKELTLPEDTNNDSLNVTPVEKQKRIRKVVPAVQQYMENVRARTATPKRLQQLTSTPQSTKKGTILPNDLSAVISEETSTQAEAEKPTRGRRNKASAKSKVETKELESTVEETKPTRARRAAKTNKKQETATEVSNDDKMENTSEEVTSTRTKRGTKRAASENKNTPVASEVISESQSTRRRGKTPLALENTTTEQTEVEKPTRGRRNKANTKSEVETKEVDVPVEETKPTRGRKAKKLDTEEAIQLEIEETPVSRASKRQASEAPEIVTNAKTRGRRNVRFEEIAAAAQTENVASPKRVTRARTKNI